MATSDDTGERSTPKFSLFWGIYGQVAAVLGALAFMVFLGNVIDLGLKGVIREVVEWWVLSVRPIVGHPINWLVSQLPESWRFEVPDFAKDYLACGLVSVLSFARVLVSKPSESADGMAVFATSEMIYALFILAIAFMLFWPVMLISMPITALMARLERRKATLQLTDVLAFSAPHIYLGLILAANAWLL